MPSRVPASMVFALAVAGLAPMCQENEGRKRTSEGSPAQVPGTGGLVGAAGAPQLPEAGNTGGAGGDGDPLHSDVFGSGSSGATTAPAVPCDYGASPTCDFARIEGCCSEKACAHASGANVFDTYPVESCEALIECVQSHPGCSTKDDPLCFQNEAPGAPCLQEAYAASHEDPEGPFAWTAALMACVCGY